VHRLNHSCDRGKAISHRWRIAVRADRAPDFVSVVEDHCRNKGVELIVLVRKRPAPFAWRPRSN
jgi:hypothetical protein